MNIEYNNSMVEQISVNDIIPNRFQPRKNFDSDLLNELADSIKQYGIVQPLVLRKLGNKFEIIAGERRYKAACMIGLKTVPSIVMELDDTSSAEIALIENIQRKDLTAIEEAKSYKQILGLGQIKQEELGKKIGKTQSTISNKLRLLNLSEEAQQALLDSKISERHARSLLRLKDKNIQNETLNKIIEKRMTVRETDKYIKDLIDNHNVEEQTEEILDFSDGEDSNDIKGDNMDQNMINNKINSQIIDNFNPNTGIPNIPDYDQININNNQQPAYINEEVVNNAQIDSPSMFFNYDNQAANMNFDSSFNQNTPMFQNNENIDPTKINTNIINNNIEGFQNNQQMQYSDQPIMDNQTNPMNYTNNIMDQQPNIPMYEQQFNPQPIYNNSNYNQQNPNMNYNNFDYSQQYNQNYYEPLQQPYNQMNPINYKNNMMDQQNIAGETQSSIMNNPYENQQKDFTNENNIKNIGSQIDDTESRTMIMQQDITGAVVVIRNNIMNLQNNGYNIEINEQDLGNLYQIIINLKK